MLFLKSLELAKNWVFGFKFWPQMC